MVHWFRGIVGKKHKLPQEKDARKRKAMKEDRWGSRRFWGSWRDQYITKPVKGAPE